MEACATPTRAIVGWLAVLVWAGPSFCVSGQEHKQDPPPATPGIVSHIKVLSDKVADVSCLEAWKRSFIRDSMTDQEKAVAIWRSNVSFVYQDPPPKEFLQDECVHDAIKSFNVYGYGMCCCASARIEELARYLGFQARGWGINGHSVPEVLWAGEWHMLDASLVNYFARADHTIASLNDVTQAVQGWLKEHPECKGNGGKLTAFRQADGWTGWKRGPGLLADCAFYDAGGWWPAKTHGWYSTMQEFDGTHGTPFTFEYGYSQGYEVNVQLRRGERLTRNWFNTGAHLNGVLQDGDAPGCLNAKIGEGAMAFLRGFGDLTDCRVGSGLEEYEVPLSDGAFRAGALVADNLACRSEDGKGPALHLRDAGRPGILELEMPTSYVYLSGKINLAAKVSAGGKIRILFSDNHGLDWREVATIEQSGDQAIDLTRFAFRRYDYRLRVRLEGKDTGLDRLNLTHAIQCSQRALPTLAQGENTISFSAGPHEGTVTIEGSTQAGRQGKQVTPMDFHPELKDVTPEEFRVMKDGASATFQVATPGEMVRLRMGGHYRVRDKKDQWDMQVSFDDGKTFKTVDTQNGPYQGISKYITVADIPEGTKAARVRWVGTQRNTTCLFLLRIDADYKQPHGGFAPVKINYTWQENGEEKKDVHVAKSPADTYKILCAAKPQMKSIALELVE